MSTYNKEQIRATLANKLARYYGVSIEEASREQLYRVIVLTVKDLLTEKRSRFRQKVKIERAKKIYYLSIEFLIGPQLRNALCNLGAEAGYRETLLELGVNIDDLYAREPDPSLGNGGLGRLAACYLDSLTTLNYPATGFSILYEYGLFKQKIVEGEQAELPDPWLELGEDWLVPRLDHSVVVRFGGKITEQWGSDGVCRILHADFREVQALPYDFMISGYNSGGEDNTDAVSALRLWKAKDMKDFNMNLFSQGQYVRAMQDQAASEIISKVLYPADNHAEGKILRLSQQYFLVSASIQLIVRDHLAAYGNLGNISEKIAIHVNDTHPALVIPELMRILLDQYNYNWEDAWRVVTNVVTYTNHTVLPEALEVWNEEQFRLQLPRVHMIINEINRRFCADLWNLYPGDWDRISRMSIIANGQVRMANLCVLASHKVNGVSGLHSEILKRTVFHDFYKYTPDKFCNVTNGIAHRRWLCYANPALAKLLDETIGPDYRTKPEKLAEFKNFVADSSVLERLEKIKRDNKAALASVIKNRNGIVVDPDSTFTVQVKRMHEYKRQLLNILRIVSLYDKLAADPNAAVAPETFIFSAKAAPSYYIAKQIIKLISYISADIERHPEIAAKIKVVFMEDYKVSNAEIIIPAADISEQISLAGKEASGTGNMKLMINGALTIGTYDGANVEMEAAVGSDNIYIFGLREGEVDELWRRGYSSSEYYNKSPLLQRVMARLSSGFNRKSFSDFVAYLLTGHGISDPYMCLADFETYIAVHARAEEDFKNRPLWNGKSLQNIAAAGVFAADRAIEEYAANIWNAKKV